MKITVLSVYYGLLYAHLTAPSTSNYKFQLRGCYRYIVCLLPFYILRFFFFDNVKVTKLCGHKMKPAHT